VFSLPPEIPGRVLVLGIKGLHQFDPYFLVQAFAYTWGRMVGGKPPEFAGDWIPAGKGMVSRLSPLALARELDDEEVWSFVRSQLLNRVPENTGAVILPPVMGYIKASERLDELRRTLALPVGEALSGPESVPGYRLQQALILGARTQGITVKWGTRLTGCSPGDSSPSLVLCLKNGSSESHVETGTLVLSVGKFLGGTVGPARPNHDLLPALDIETGFRDPGESRLFSPQTEAFMGTGVEVDHLLRPQRLMPLQGGDSWQGKVFVAGAALANTTPGAGTGMGMAVSTGMLAGILAARRVS